MGIDKAGTRENRSADIGWERSFPLWVSTRCLNRKQGRRVTCRADVVPSMSTKYIYVFFFFDFFAVDDDAVTGIAGLLLGLLHLTFLRNKCGSVRYDGETTNE